MRYKLRAQITVEYIVDTEEYDVDDVQDAIALEQMSIEAAPGEFLATVERPYVHVKVTAL
jgi:hypothetical protein